MSSGTNLGKAYVQIVPSAQGIKGSITKVMNGESVAAGKASGINIAGAIKGAIVAAGIGEALKKSLLEGAAIEQSMGGVETLFKDSADTVIKNADKAWKTAGLSANDYMQQSTSFAASLLQSLDGDTVAAAKYADMAIIDMSDNANKMGSSIESIQNAYQGFAKQNYTMLDNLKLGYGGTKGEMQRLLEDASKLSGQNYDISNLSDVYEAIHVIQGELDITGTTAKEAATTLEGSFNSMKAAASNFMGNIAMRPELVQESLKNLIDSVGTFLFKNLTPAIGNILQAIPQVIGSFMQGDFVGKLMSNLETISGKLLEGASSFIDVGLGLIVRLAQGIANGLPTIIQKLPIIVGNIADIINNNAPKLIVAGLTIIKTLAVGIVRAVPTLIANIPAICKAIFKVFTAFSWAGIGRSIVLKIAKGLRGMAGSLFGSIRGIVSRIKGLFSFKFSLPKLKVPKFAITPKGWKVGDLLKGKIPHLSVKWNKEGGIFNSASIVGYGVGEAGAEAIIPLNTFWSKMDAMAEAIKTNNGGGQMTVIMQLDGQTIGQSTVNYINGQTLQFNASPLMV